jgi:hypothetical protein
MMIDVLLPTAGKRMNGLKFQIQAILNNSYKDIRLWTLIDNDNAKEIRDELRKDLKFDSRHKTIVVPEEWRGNWGHRPIKYAIEKLPLEGEWIITSGDDDVITEWALDELIRQSQGVNMVVGICLPVSRMLGQTDRVLGEHMAYGHITGSCCLYRSSSVREVGYDDSTYEADWKLIEKMMRFPLRQIKSVLFVMPQSFEGVN